MIHLQTGHGGARLKGSSQNRDGPARLVCSDRRSKKMRFSKVFAPFANFNR